MDDTLDFSKDFKIMKCLQEFLEKKIDQEVATARKNAKTNKRSALQALKRKKR